MLDMGQNPQLGFKPIHESQLKSLDNFASRMAQVTKEAQAALVKAADNMAQFYDSHQHEAQKYNVGNKVWLSSENMGTVCLAKKLDYKWLGPYVIEQVISRSAYRLKLPTSFSRIHPVFSLLCPFKGDLIAKHQEHHPPLPPPIVRMASKSMKSKRSSTARYSVERLST